MREGVGQIAQTVASVHVQYKKGGFERKIQRGKLAFGCRFVKKLHGATLRSIGKWSAGFQANLRH